MHVSERNGRRTAAPWSSRGHVFRETHRLAPVDTADGGAGAGIDALPGDILAVVLRRLRAHSLARCRCVCALWRDLVDGRGLLLPHALPPRAFPGFFANARPKPLSRPRASFLPPPASRGPARDRLAFLRLHLPRASAAAAAVRHQCNGLVLCFARDYLAGVGFVCNPVTERWARLPPPPTWWPRGYEGLFLVFDPAVSLDYEVLLLPVPPPRQSHGDDGGPIRQGHVTLGMFVPESFGKPQEPDGDEKLLPLLAFSSVTGRWTKRLLAPGRCAPARLYDRVMRRRRRSAEGVETWARTWRPSAVYCRGSLYAHCEKRILVVLRCSEGTYDIVKLPSIAGADAGAVAGQGERYAAGHVLSSLPVDSIFPGAEAGVLVRYASADVFRVRVWALHESAGDGGRRLLEWTLTHDADLAAHARMLDLLHHAPSNCVPLPTEEESTGRGAGKCVWFSDEDGEEAAGNGDAGDGCSGRWNRDDASLLDLDIGADELLDVGAGAPSPFSILGCHPDKEVIYLAAGAFHVVAYHLGSGKVQYLGRVMSLGDGDVIDGVFPYRPCIVDALPHDTCLFPSLKSTVKSQ